MVIYKQKTQQELSWSVYTVAAESFSLKEVQKEDAIQVLLEEDRI